MGLLASSQAGTRHFEVHEVRGYSSLTAITKRPWISLLRLCPGFRSPSSMRDALPAHQQSLGLKFKSKVLSYHPSSPDASWRLLAIPFWGAQDTKGLISLRYS